MTTAPFLLAGTMLTGSATATIHSPYDGTVVGHAGLASRADVEAAIDAAVSSARAAADLPSHARAAVLVRIAGALDARKEEMARLLAAEAGKPVGLARVEI